MQNRPECKEPDLTSIKDPGSKNRYIILLLILTGILMAVVDGSVVSIALPTITGYFHVSLAESQWVMTSYLVTLTSLLLIFGKIAEYTGRARLFFMGMLLFTISSLACGLSSSLSMLILFRIVQAIGAAMMFSISAAIIFLSFPRGEQGRAMGYIGATVAIGSIIGPTLGGVIVDTLGWEYIFLINVPIGILQLILSVRYLRIEDPRSSCLKVDWIGAITLVAFMVSMMAMLGMLADDNAFQPTIAALALVFLASLGVFLINESRQKATLLELSIFRCRDFLLPSISMIVFFIANLMVVVLGPFFFQGVMGYSAFQVGLIYLIVPAITMVGSPVTGWVYDKWPCRYFALLGMTVLALAMMAQGYLAGRMDRNPELLLLTFVPMGIGSALFQSPNNTDIMRALPKDKMNIASSVTATVRNLGMTLGVSLSGIIVSLQLSEAGYHGTVLEASPQLLSGTLSRGIFLAGIICIIGALASLGRWCIKAKASK
jgi:EmrB/QacA subfamily drug resistance transporter